MQDVQFGQYAIPVLLTVILAIAYKFVGQDRLKDKWKSLIACLVGIGLGFLALWYNGLDWNPVNIVDHAIYGLMTGAASVGLYELQRTVTKPRQ